MVSFALNSPSASWPDIAREDGRERPYVPATHALLRGTEDVGARHKAGHDSELAQLAQLGSSFSNFSARLKMISFDLKLLRADA